MRKAILMTLLVSFSLSMPAQGLKEVKLNDPSKDRGKSVMKTLADRRSVREFSTQPLSKQDLSDLLWAANGISSVDGKRTAPSAMNKQDVDVYVVMAEGAYLYDAQKNILQPIAAGDHRGLLAGKQTFVADAPVILVMVSDLSRFGRVDDLAKSWGAIDAGCVSQNVNLFCSGIGLATVPRASMDQDALKKIFKLSDSQLLLMNNPVGYPKK